MYEFWKKSPWSLRIAIGAVGLFALFPLLNLLALAFTNLKLGLGVQLTYEQLGQTGDFFGGHTAAFSGTLSLAVVLFFTFHQYKQQSEHFHTQRNEEQLHAERVFFLTGINLITQWDISQPGCDQCMRLLDYYSRLALKSKDEELFLILNTVVTAKIRQNLQGKNGSFRKTNYPFACEALEHIATIRKKEGIKRSEERKKAVPHAT